MKAVLISVVARVRAAYQGVLHRMPRYRQKLEWIPLEGRPVWVDDPDFDLDDHVRHLALPRPGREAELQELVLTLPRVLDRDGISGLEYRPW